MKLEDQLTNLELSKRLKELGVKQESLFYLFWNGKDEIDFDFDIRPKWSTCVVEGRFGYFKYSAFTVSELGELLPKAIPNPEKRWKELYFKSEPGSCLGNWLVSYGFEIWKEESIEANARASMLIHLLENKLMELQK